VNASPSSFVRPETLATADIDGRGAVFTRPEVVNFILDLAGYTAGGALENSRLLEPAVGEGEFLVAAIHRLTTALAPKAVNGWANAWDVLRDRIVAVEIHQASLDVAFSRAREALMEAGVPGDTAGRLARHWIRQGDFLSVPIEGKFSHVVGNPPYVRQELIPEATLAFYRATYRTLYDRADLFVPFFERCLNLLQAGGKLSFICTDRWMKNKYGGPLRQLLADEFWLTHYVDMTDCPAFIGDVTTYPAVTVMERPVSGDMKPATKVAYRPLIESAALANLARSMTTGPSSDDVLEMSDVVQGSQPLLVHDASKLALVRRLEAAYPSIEDAGCKVGIGVATGADKLYIRPMDELDVEDERKLPLARTQDLAGAEVRWTGYGVLNPFEADGRLADLKAYPRFSRYLAKHEDAIRARNVAKRNGEGWFRTIDRIHTPLTYRPKLLIPDIKGAAVVAFEAGRLYPHHNLYYVISDEWDLRALQAVLLSGIARLFVATYSTKMRGGFLRYQAQFLRRIRLPRWSDVPVGVRNQLSDAGSSGDTRRANAATADLYRLSLEERQLLEER
jgi:hypothetical protein